MTLSEIIAQILVPAVGTRVWQNATPDDLPRSSTGVILPFVIWQRMGGQDDTYVEQSPAPEYSHARIQITYFTTMSITTDKLWLQGRDLMLAAPYTVGVYGSPVGAHDAPRKLQGLRQQYSIWFRQTP